MSWGQGLAGRALCAGVVLLILSGSMTRAQAADADTRPKVAVCYVLDPTGAWTIETVSEPQFAPQFAPLSPFDAVFRLTRPVIWLRITAQMAPVGSGTPLDSRLITKINWPFIEKMTLFIPFGEENWTRREITAGGEQPFAFMIQAFPEKPTTMYVRIEGHMRLANPVEPLRALPFMRRIRVDAVVLGAWAGMLVFMSFFALYYARIARTSATWWYGLQTICVGLIFLPLVAQLNERFSGWSLHVLNMLSTAAEGLFFLCACQFSRYFLAEDESRPLPSRFLAAGGVLAGISAVSLPFIPPEWEAVRWFLPLAYSVALIMVAVNRPKSPVVPRRLFIGAWLCLLSGTVLELCSLRWDWHIFGAGSFRILEFSMLALSGILFCAQSRQLVLSLRQSRERFATANEYAEGLDGIFRGVHSGLALIDNTGTILKVNPNMRTFGNEEAVRVGAKCHCAFFDRETTCPECPAPEVMQTGRPVYRLTTVKRPDYTPPTRIIQSTCSPVPQSAAGRITQVLVEFTDITDQLETEAQLRQSEKLSAIGQLAGGVAHDFNNQLTVIGGYVELLLGDPMAPEDQRDCLEKVRSATKRSADLTRQLLSFARKAVPKCETLNMHAIIRETVQLVNRSFDKRIRTTEHLRAADDTVQGDSSQLQSVLLNLALNSRDAMPDGGEITFTTQLVRITEETARLRTYDVSPGEFVEIAITDSGCGMSREVQAHLFEPFFTTKAVGKGTGMGLAAVYGSIKNHFGYILCESSEGAGTTFRVGLPHARPQTHSERRSTTTVLAKRRATIMVIDDEPDVAGATAEMLRSLGYTPEVHNRSSLALEEYRRRWRGIDLVLMDMIMPELGGAALFAELRLINPEASIVIMSGFSLTEDIQRLRAAGASGFIEKPFDFVRFSQIIRQALTDAGKARRFLRPDTGKPENGA